MHTKILIATALAVGTMTAVSHAANNSPQVPAIVTANGASGGSFGDLMKQVLRGGKAAPGSEAEGAEEPKAKTVASAERTATGSVGASKKGSEVKQARRTVQQAKPADGSLPYHDIVSRYAGEYGVPIALAHAIISVESNYRVSARGRAGEIGLMQIKPSTARGMGYRGTVNALYSPETNIKYGMKYLARAYQLGGGKTCGAILRYNAGHGAKRMNPISSAYCTKVLRILGR